MEIKKIDGKIYITINGITKNQSEWAKEYGLSPNTIQWRIKAGWDEKDIFSPSKYIKHIFNEHYFDVIDNEHKAYWLGFIYADGYLNSKDSVVGIELNHRDIEHLNKFKNDLESNLSVKTYNKNSTFGPQTNCRFVFNNKIIYNALIEHGITTTKSLNGSFPIVDKEEFVKDTIRGIVDGDGSFGYKIGAYGYPIARMNICGTKSVLQSIEDYSGFNWSWSQRHPDRDIDNYSISTGQQNQIIDFLNYLYGNASIYLDRKYNIYKNIINGRKDFIGRKIPNHLIDKQNKIVGV